MLEQLTVRLNQWLFEPPEHLAGPRMWALRLLRYPYALLRDLLQGQLNLRAMSLVYTTLLSIAPLLALSFSVLKGLGIDRDLEPVIYEFLEPLGGKATELTARIMGFVNSVRGGVLGSLGLAFLLYNVISTVQKIEESFNFVWRVEQPRSWSRRFSEYLSVLVVGPVVIVAALGLIAALSNSRIVQALLHVQPFGPWLVQAGHLLPYLLVSGVFTFLYTFVPNTKVRLYPALVGGVFAGILWAASGVLFARFVATSSQTALIYAGFAIVIVALFWVYVSWLVLLLGVQLSFYVQHPECLRPGRGAIHLTAGLRERLALSAMFLIARAFKDGKHRWTTQSLSEQLDLPSAPLAEILDSLESNGLLVTTEDEQLVPGRDIAAIQLADIFSAVRHDTQNPRVPKVRSAGPAEDIARAADTALTRSVAGKSLADLIA